MQLIFSVTNRAILRSGKELQGNRCTIECKIADLPQDARRPLADRLVEDSLVCEGILNEADAVEPRLGEYGEPVLLRVDGRELRDLVEAVRQD